MIFTFEPREALQASLMVEKWYQVGTGRLMLISWYIVVKTENCQVALEERENTCCHKVQNPLAALQQTQVFHLL